MIRFIKCKIDFLISWLSGEYKEIPTEDAINTVQEFLNKRFKELNKGNHG